MSWKEEKVDLISREALLKAVEEERQYLLARGEIGAEHILVHHCLPLIDNAPAVSFIISSDYVTELQNRNKELIKQLEEAERPQGKWVVQRLQSGFDDVYCPYCNARPTRSEYGYYLRDNFCHECGADMRGAK